MEEEPETVKIPDYAQPLPLMTQGQWMKGCPEGAEQGFLFSLYSELSDGSCACPNQCGFSVTRNKRDFFAIYVIDFLSNFLLLKTLTYSKPEFPAYVQHLKSFVRVRCRKCSSSFCLACGEPVTAERTQAGVMALDENPLYHCSNLQGVILGVGLAMLENLFVQQSRDGSVLKTPDAKNAKKRKAEASTATPIPNPSFDDDEDDTYFGVNKGGKKAKGGIGYAGALREDVIMFYARLSQLANYLSRRLLVK